VARLQYAHAREKEIAPADLQLLAGMPDDALIGDDMVVADLPAALPRSHRADDAPDDDAVQVVRLFDHHPHMRHGTAGHHRAPVKHIALLDGEALDI